MAYRKDATNRQSTASAFIEAATIFRGLIVVTEDTRRDYGERRLIAIGEYDGEVIRVVFAERGDAVRIISAWKANRNEREKYQKERQDRPL